MNVTYVMEKGASGGAHQAHAIREGVDQDIDLIRSVPLDLPNDVLPDRDVVEGERGIKYPTRSLVDAVRSQEPDVAMFHILDQDAWDAVSEITSFTPTVLRVGLNPFEIGLMKDEMPQRVIEYMASFDHVVTASHAAKHKIMGCGVQSDRITVIPTAISMNEDETHAPRRDVPLNIGTLSRLEPVKNHHTVLYALSILQDIDRTLTPMYHIAGAGRKAEMIDGIAAGLGLAANQVGLHGYVHDPEQLFGRIGLHVHPSLSENMPQSVLEAARAGLPTLAAEAAWTREFDSIVTAPHDAPVVWATKIYEFLTNDAWRYDVAQEQQQEVMEKYSMEVVAPRYTELFKRMVADYRDFKIPPEVKV